MKPEPAKVVAEAEAAPQPWRRKAMKTAAAAAGSAAWFALCAAAMAATGEGEHLHVGQKLAIWLQSSGLPAEAILMIISALPVVELRGGVPVGIWMGMPVAKTCLLCVIGNMLPIVPILLALRSPLVRRIMKPILTRAQSKAEAFADEASRARGLAIFVGIPLPGTGAWTGAMGAYLLGMPLGLAVSSIFAGVLLAAAIMSLIVTTGTAGGVAACVALVAIFAIQTWKGPSSKGNTAKPEGAE